MTCKPLNAQLEMERLRGLFVHFTSSVLTFRQPTSSFFLSKIEDPIKHKNCISYVRLSVLSVMADIKIIE